MRDYELKIPKNELLFVQPETRMKLYSNLLAEYKKRYPELKCIYNVLLWGNINTECKSSKVFVNKINGRRLTGDRKADYLDNGKNPIVVEETIKYPATHQDIAVDYCLIFRSPYENEMYFELPYIHTNGSIPGYRYCLREDKLDMWFKIILEDMPHISVPLFMEYIEGNLELSLNKEDDLYWKNSTNKAKLISGLIDLQLRYVPKI